MLTSFAQWHLVSVQHIFILLDSHCIFSNPEVLGQPEEEVELGAEMVGDLVEEGTHLGE